MRSNTAKKKKKKYKRKTSTVTLVVSEEAGPYKSSSRVGHRGNHKEPYIFALIRLVRFLPLEISPAEMALNLSTFSQRSIFSC